MTELNPNDYKILSHLMEDSRLKITNISKKTKIPISTIFDRINYLRGDIIKKFSCVLDFEKMGFPIKVKVLIDANSKDKKIIESYLNSHKNVNSCYKINNGFNFIAECFFQNIKRSEMFVEELEEKFDVNKIKSFYVVKDVKKEGFNLLSF